MNFTDEFATIAAILTLLNGIFFLEPVTKDEETSVIVLFMSVLFFNAVFIIYWCCRMLGVVYQKIKGFFENKVAVKFEKRIEELSKRNREVESEIMKLKIEAAGPSLEEKTVRPRIKEYEINSERGLLDEHKEVVPK